MFGSPLDMKEICKQTNKTPHLSKLQPEITGCKKQIIGPLAKQMYPNSSRPRCNLEHSATAAQHVLVCVWCIHVCCLCMLRPGAGMGCLLHHAPPLFFEAESLTEPRAPRIHLCLPHSVVVTDVTVSGCYLSAREQHLTHQTTSPDSQHFFKSMKPRVTCSVGI